MSPRIHSVVSSGALLLAAWLSPFAHAQDAAPAAGSVQDEIRALRQAVEMQSKQIEVLTLQVNRLSLELERRGLATPPAAGAGAVAPAAPGVPSDAHAHAAAEFAPAPRVVAPTGNVHIIVKGDSLDKIAKMHNTTIAELQRINKITDPKKLQIGQQIILPPTAATEKKEGQ